LTASVGSESDAVIATFWYGAIMPASVSVGATLARLAVIVGTGGGGGGERACFFAPAAPLPHPATASVRLANSASGTSFFIVAAILPAKAGRGLYRAKPHAAFIGVGRRAAQSRSTKYARRPSAATRSWRMESRSCTVTVPSASVS